MSPASIYLYLSQMFMIITKSIPVGVCVGGEEEQCTEEDRVANMHSP